MDSLPDSLLLQILSRIDDSADVARCRVASKAFDTVFPELRSINLRCSEKCGVRVSRPLKAVFLDLISKLKSVESVCISHACPLMAMLRGDDIKRDDFYLTDDDFAKEWLPTVSESLKTLSLSGIRCFDIKRRQSNVLSPISEYCHNLVKLKFKYAWLSKENLNPMPMLTRLTLESTTLEDELLNELNTCFPNLQVLKLVDIAGLEHPKIHLINLKTCHWAVNNHLISLTLITPNLITLKFQSYVPVEVHVETPKLSHCLFIINTFEYVGTITFKKFENLKTLLLNSTYLGPLLSKFPVTNTLENLTLEESLEDLRYEDSVRREPNVGDLKLNLAKVFMVFPNVSSLCINSGAWSELEGWEMLNGGKALKKICAYLVLNKPLRTFKYVARVLDQCDELSEVSFLIQDNVVGMVAERFMSKCMARWPGLKWRWGIWGDDIEDSWISPTDGIST